MIEHIISDLRQYGKKILIVEDVHGFLARNDVKEILYKNKILISEGTTLAQRIDFHLADSHSLQLFISNQEDHLEDLRNQAQIISFTLKDYLGSYHLPSIAKCELIDLDKLYQQSHIVNLNAEETEMFLSANLTEPEETYELKYDNYRDQINALLGRDDVNWHIIMSLLSDIIIDKPSLFDDNTYSEFLKEINIQFQKALKAGHKSLKNTSAILKPKVVSKVLDHIAFNYKDEKVALVVVDGLSYWQYKMLSKLLPEDLIKIEDITSAWIPSITQLSRQALFRGSAPDKVYVQNPRNENKLWLKYWTEKGFGKDEMEYQHDPKEFKVSSRVRRLGVVFKDLDDKMHSSSDYVDLKGLTENWFERSNLISFLENLLIEGFEIILTSDHGNIQAQGWRTLTGIEKLGTNKSGSRSQRHIEYTDSELVDKFVNNNDDIRESIIEDGQAIYFKDDKSFSTLNSLVTHGGSHMLEVIIPFIKLSKDRN